MQEQLIKKDDTVVVAVSGGADSLSLLILLNRLRMEPDLAFSLHVAHLNHGLRGISAAGDAKFVRQTAKGLGLPCTVGKARSEEYQKKRGLSPEDAARQLRYRFLMQLAEKVRANSIAVGHNLDDQVETVLLNFFRGTGPDGLAGMKLSRKAGENGPALIRPLLNSSRRAIEVFCRSYGLHPRVDETNKDPQFLRNRIRGEILPLLEDKVNPNLREGLYRLSQLFTLDRDYWEHVTESRLKKVLLDEGAGCLVFDRRLFMREHEALQGRIIRLAAGRLLGSIPRGVDYRRVQEVLDLVRKNKPRGIVSFPHGMVITRDYEKIMATLPGVHRGESGHGRGLPRASLFVPGEIAMDPPGTVLRARLSETGALTWPPDEKKVAYLDFDRLLGLISPAGFSAKGNKGAVLQVRGRMPGDRFYPLGAPGKRKLKDYFIDRKISWEKRNNIPLVVAGDEIVWVMGGHISHLCRVTEDTKKVVVLSLETI